MEESNERWSILPSFCTEEVVFHTHLGLLAWDSPDWAMKGGVEGERSGVLQVSELPGPLENEVNKPSCLQGAILGDGAKEADISPLPSILLTLPPNHAPILLTFSSASTLAWTSCCPPRLIASSCLPQ